MSDETTELILTRLGEIQDENRVDHGMMKDTLTEHGQRIVKVETKLTGLVPKVEVACKKANSVKVSVAELKGEKKGTKKVMRYVWPIILILIGAAVPLLIGWLK